MQNITGEEKTIAAKTSNCLSTIKIYKSSLSFLNEPDHYLFLRQLREHQLMWSITGYPNENPKHVSVYAATGWTRPAPEGVIPPAAFWSFVVKYLSTAAAACRPSVMAQTTSDCPRLQSPAAKTPSTLVAKSPNWALKFDLLSFSRPSLSAIVCRKTRLLLIHRYFS